MADVLPLADLLALLYAVPTGFFCNIPLLRCHRPKRLTALVHGQVPVVLFLIRPYYCRIGAL